MAGHSKFKNIQHRKGAQDKKRAKIFTKLVREIITAAKIGGPDINNNPRLRSSITSAKSHNLPKDRIDKALLQASDPLHTDNYSEIRYEGFASGGIAIIVETLTDNKNRTASEVRSAFTKYGGNLGEPGSVTFMFDKIGKIQYPNTIGQIDDVMESAIDAGANDLISEEEKYIIFTDITEFIDVLEFFRAKYGKDLESDIIWHPKDVITIDNEEKALKILKLIDALEDSDDVQTIFGNYKFHNISNLI